MANYRGFFLRFKGLCARRMDASLVREPTVAVPNEEPRPVEQTEVVEPSTTGDASPSSIDVPLLPIENAQSPSSIATTRESDVEELRLKNDAPLVTEDVYDPLIMNFSPKISRLRAEAADSDTCKSPTRDVNSISQAAATSTSSGHTAEQGVFWYGITLFSDVGSKPMAESAQKNHVSVLDDRIKTRTSPDFSPSKLAKCRSSLRYYDLMGHRISEDWADLNSRVYDALLQYFTGSDLTAGQKISKQWSDNVRLLMGKKTAKIVAAFKVAYQGQLDFESSYMICQSVFTAQKGMRIDLIIRARVLAWSVNSKNTLQYTYSYIPRSTCDDVGARQPTYANRFVFECLRRNTRRTVSFMRDVSSVHGDDLHVATAESVSQVCEGDSIEIPVVLMNALGNTNVDSIKFLPMRREAVEGEPASSLDKMHREWYTVGPNSHYLQQLFPADIVAYNLVQPEKLQPELEHQVTQVAGIDVITSRSRFIAAKPGPVTEAQNFIGHTMEVIDARQPVVCMLQRSGVQCDRLCHVQLRVGDKVRFYTTKG
ncbi:hypothetical protein, conserved [Babesia bigemina]|uniref:Uncharacterized protein n=1 Tax=Babesia bigemina TaxID=5866 RepID=A0A061D2E9_BABBI|nr:hypothetical protein, conserved [Babesia bigemina]CDR94267.1 hypothetical protein, conserved [Babesia bigemina]|eukprot:XP_012766453.1 hypothetical protein, conserved [Babesia bigemina]